MANPHEFPLHDLDQVASKADLRILGAEPRAEFTAQLSSEIGGLRRTMTNWFMLQSGAIIGTIAGVASLT